MNKIKIKTSDGKDIKLCNSKLNPLMKKFVDKLWFKYYSLFGIDCIEKPYYICLIPISFFLETNKYYFINNYNFNQIYLKYINYKNKREKLFKKRRSFNILFNNRFII